MGEHSKQHREAIKDWRRLKQANAIILILFSTLLIYISFNWSQIALEGRLVAGFIPETTFLILGAIMCLGVPLTILLLLRILKERMNSHTKALSDAFRQYEEIKNSLPHYIMFENLREYWTQAENKEYILGSIEKTWDVLKQIQKEQPKETANQLMSFLNKSGYKP